MVKMITGRDNGDDGGCGSGDHDHNEEEEEANSMVVITRQIIMKLQSLMK